MQIIYERWCECCFRTRFLCWSISTFAVLLGAFWIVVRPASQQTASLSVDHERAITAIGTLWVSARQHHAGEVEHESAAVLPFSPLDFQTGGTQLIRWQPDANGGELTLDAEWINIPVLFNRLAQRGMGVMTFSVEPGKSRLVVVVRVESLHAK